ncbi:hypothetical protein [Deinococcus sp.]|uniref:hypothetical protein n=1 Tax=Deinococcus sp. TaxID=47478 RepID=UPI003B5B5483
MKSLLIYALPLALMVSSCGKYNQPTPIGFDSDYRIMRGEWGGEISDGRTIAEKEADSPKASLIVGKQINLQMVASYVNQSMYEVNGTASLGSESYQIEGQVDGKETDSYLKGQARVNFPSEVNLQISSGGKIFYSLHCYYYGSSSDSQIIAMQCRGVDGIFPISGTFPNNVYPGWGLNLSRKVNP